MRLVEKRASGTAGIAPSLQNSGSILIAAITKAKAAGR